MTDKDEMAIRGEMMTEYTSNEGKIAALREAVLRIGRSMEHAGKTLQGGRYSMVSVDANAVQTPATTNYSQDAKVIPATTLDLSALGKMLTDVRALQSRQSELRPSLESFGFLPKCSGQRVGD